MATVLQRLVKSISVTSQWLPPLELDDPFAPGPPSPVMEILKPKITIVPAAGEPIVSAPWGEPTEDNWSYARWVLLAAGALAVFGIADLVIYRFVKPRGRRRGLGSPPEVHAAQAPAEMARAARHLSVAARSLSDGDCHGAFVSLAAATAAGSVAAAHVRAAGGGVPAASSLPALAQRVRRASELFEASCLR